MEVIHIVALSLIVFILALGFIIIKIKRKMSPLNQAHLEYIAGLNHMINGENDKALEHLRKTVRLNTDLIDAYIKIGDILRVQGHADQAVKVHRDLLVREELSDHKRIAIYKSLALDYQQLGSYSQAVDACEQVLSMNKNSQWTKDMLLSVYEEMGDWRNAFALFKKSDKNSKDNKNRILACYKVEEGLSLAALKKEHEARLCFREAIKLDKACAGGYQELADSYIREDRLKDALAALKQLIQRAPEQAYLAFSRLKHVLFDMGQFSEIERLYVDLMKTNPDVIEAYIGLSDLLEKKGELLQAIDVCKKAMEKDDSRLELKIMLIRLRSKLGMKDQAANLAEKLAQEIVADHHNFVCAECNYQSNDYFWHCPECRAWNSAKRVKIAYP